MIRTKIQIYELSSVIHEANTLGNVLLSFIDGSRVTAMPDPSKQSSALPPANDNPPKFSV